MRTSTDAASPLSQHGHVRLAAHHGHLGKHHRVRSRAARAQRLRVRSACACARGVRFSSRSCARSRLRAARPGTTPTRP
jgi:hypothetical protein